MAKLVINNAKKPQLLTEDRQAYLSSLDWRIFVNDLTPTSSTSLGSFTEATDSGYAPGTFTFGSPTLNGSDQGEMEGDPVDYTFTHDVGDWTIYGIYGTDPADSDEWVIAQRLGTAIPVVAPGQIFQVTPLYTTDQEP